MFLLKEMLGVVPMRTGEEMPLVASKSKWRKLPRQKSKNNPGILFKRRMLGFLSKPKRQHII